MTDGELALMTRLAVSTAEATMIERACLAIAAGTQAIVEVANGDRVAASSWSAQADEHTRLAMIAGLCLRWLKHGRVRC